MLYGTALQTVSMNANEPRHSFIKGWVKYERQRINALLDSFAKGEYELQQINALRHSFIKGEYEANAMDRFHPRHL